MRKIPRILFPLASEGNAAVGNIFFVTRKGHITCHWVQIPVHSATKAADDKN